VCDGGENEPYAQPGYYPLVRGAFVQCTPRLACRGGRNASCSPLYTGDRCAQCALGAYRCGEAAGDAIAVVSLYLADGRVRVVLCVLTGPVAPSTVECMLHVYPRVLSSVVPTQEHRPGVRLASSRLTPRYHGPHASACMCACECMCVWQAAWDMPQVPQHCVAAVSTVFGGAGVFGGGVGVPQQEAAEPCSAGHWRGTYA
jgi:hypothetical protein